MIAYEVTVDVAPARAAAFARYMRETHIPEILATACFASIVFERASEGRYRTRYVARTADALERYLSAHTAHFRADFATHFPTGVSASREVWTEDARWEGEAAPG